MRVRARVTSKLFAFGFALGLALASVAGARAEIALQRAVLAGAACGLAGWTVGGLVPATPRRAKEPGA